MQRSRMNVKQVAASLHVSPREVVRMAEQRVLAGIKVRGEWQFRAGEVWNWVEENLQALPQHRRRDRHPEPPGHMLVTGAMKEHGMAVDLVAKTKASVLRELAELAAAVDPYVDAGILVEDLVERERQCSTGLQDGVAIPHPPRPIYSEGPIVVAARTCQGIVFGEPRGGLTDLFFLVCCPEQADHLLYLGRLCRLLIDKDLQASLRSAESASEFLDALHTAESTLCQSV